MKKKTIFLLNSVFPSFYTSGSESTDPNKCGSDQIWIRLRTNSFFMEYRFILGWKSDWVHVRFILALCNVTKAIEEKSLILWTKSAEDTFLSQLVKT